MLPVCRLKYCLLILKQTYNKVADVVVKGEQSSSYSMPLGKACLD